MRSEPSRACELDMRSNERSSQRIFVPKKRLGHFLIFPKNEHFNASSVPLGQCWFYESRMCHKYSAVKGRQRCLGEAGGKIFLRLFL